MEPKDKRCGRCEYYKKYYVKNVYDFVKTDYGYCSKCQKICGKKEKCDEWTRINTERLKFLRDVSIKYLQDAIFKIIKLRRIVTELQNECEETSPEE